MAKRRRPLARYMILGLSNVNVRTAMDCLLPSGPDTETFERMTPSGLSGDTLSPVEIAKSLQFLGTRRAVGFKCLIDTILTDVPFTAFMVSAFPSMNTA